MQSSKTLSEKTTSHSILQTFSDESLLKSQNVFSDLQILKIFSQGKFKLYLTYSQSQKAHYLMKVFLFQDSAINPHFLNECKTSGLKHPHILTPVSVQLEKDFWIKGKAVKGSYTLTEYAPHGDFFDLITKHPNQINEKLIRTYFHQLVQGLEFLHSNGIYHFDIKLENLVLDKDYQLRIIDFDLSHRTKNDAASVIKASGTVNYRAPEAQTNSSIWNPEALDVYSLGVVLFLMLSGGYLPFSEGEALYQTLQLEPKIFWRRHCLLQGKSLEHWSSDFRTLIQQMLREKPQERATIHQIKQSNWYQGPVYEKYELISFMRGIMKESSAKTIQV